MGLYLIKGRVLNELDTWKIERGRDRTEELVVAVVPVQDVGAQVRPVDMVLTLKRSSVQASHIDIGLEHARFVVVVYFFLV